MGSVLDRRLLGTNSAARSDQPFTLAGLPRIDVHTHFSNHWGSLEEVMELRDTINEQLRADLAILISPGRADRLDLGRCASGIRGESKIDPLANDPVFDKMEPIGMVAASTHVANPCGTFGQRTEWFPDPVEFWRQQRASELVFRKHSRLTVGNDRLLWLCYSDEQLDYLRYMLRPVPT